MALIKVPHTPIEEVEVPWNKPYFIKGYAHSMPALKKWKDLDYFKDRMQNVDVDVEVYKTEKDFEMSRASIQTIPFNNYLETMGDNSGNEQPYIKMDKGGRTYVPDCDLRDFGNKIHPDIFTDLINPNDFRLGLQDGDGVPGVPDGYNLYIGVDTKTGMHAHIEDDFMLNQIVGTKKVYCVDWHTLDLQPMWSKYNNFSKQNFFDLDWDKMDIQYAELEPGDAFCFPPWIWHAVESNGYTCAITKVYEREDQTWLYHKSNQDIPELKHRMWLSSFVPRLIYDWIRKKSW